MISASFILFSILFRIVVDYSDLPDKYKDLFEADEVRREGDRLQRHVNELSNTIQRIQAPNMRVRFLFYSLFSVINFFTVILYSTSGYAKIGLGERKVTRDKRRV